jgi:hypothetical protein
VTSIISLTRSDHAYIRFNNEEYIPTYSINPPIVSQNMASKSDIFGGNGPPTDPLVDSALTRVRLWEALNRVNTSAPTSTAA